MDSIDRYEIRAAVFYETTGYIAPGKDVSGVVSTETYEQNRHSSWDDFNRVYGRIIGMVLDECSAQLAAEKRRADEEAKLRQEAFDAHAKLEANWREAERWREEAFICLTHCEAVGADKAAAMFRTLLSRMGIEEPPCQT